MYHKDKECKINRTDLHLTISSYFTPLTSPPTTSGCQPGLAKHARLVVTEGGLGRIEPRRDIGQEIGWHQASPTSDFPHIETIVVHIAKDSDDLPSLEGELHLTVNIRAELTRIIVVQCDLPPDRHVLVDVSPSVVSLHRAAPVRLLRGGTACLLSEQLFSHSLVVHLQKNLSNLEI